MRKIKILHLHTLPVISGSGINVFLTMVGLDKEKYEVAFGCAPGGDLVNQVVKYGIRFRPIKHFVQEINLYHDLMALGELMLLMKSERYDIVHTHNSKAGFLGRLAARLVGVPIVVHTIHGFAFHEFEKPPRRILFILLEKFAANLADKLITISEPLKEWGLRLKIGKKEQYTTIYSGIEIEKFKIEIDVEKKKREFGINFDDLVVGVVAKLWEGKGHRDILIAAKEVVKEIPNVKFMFVGEGYLRRELEKLTQELELDNHVIFTGFRRDIPEITAIFDIAVLASYYEGMGRVLLEAMVLAKPVVATKVGGIVDVVEDGKTGFLVPPKNPKALAEAMIRLLSDERLRKIMGKEARKRIDTRFSAQAMVSKIEEVYQELIKRKEGILRKRR